MINQGGRTMTDAFKAVKPAGRPPILLFDLGNILVRLNPVNTLWPDQTPAAGSLSFSERWGLSRAVRDYETGRLADLDAFYLAAREELGFTVPEEQFVQVFRQVIGEPFTETIPLLQALQPFYPLMLLSNTSRDHWEYCRDQLGLGGFFQDEFLSYRMGVMKPNPLIFRQVLAVLPEEPQNIWYFDDKAENTAVATSLGFRAFTCWGGEPLVRQLRQLGLIQA